MALRQIIEIDESLCDGCGLCIPGCPEGALRIIDGKARLLSDAFCDGLGACIGHCPQGAITVREREAEPYDERKVMETIVKQGPNVLQAHLDHLADHGEMGLLREAMAVLREKGIALAPTPAPASGGCAGAHPASAAESHHHAHGPGGCPGSRVIDFRDQAAPMAPTGPVPSQLRQWPVQLHLVNPAAPYFRDADLLLAADCVAFAVGSFHGDHLKGRSLAIACPKLDDGMDAYREKLTAMIDTGGVRSVTVMIMQVPCCRGLAVLMQEAARRAARRVPMKAVIVSLQGEILSEETLSA